MRSNKLEKIEAALLQTERLTVPRRDSFWCKAVSGKEKANLKADRMLKGCFRILVFSMLRRFAVIRQKKGQMTLDNTRGIVMPKLLDGIGPFNLCRGPL